MTRTLVDLRKDNPYPENIFIEPTEQDYKIMGEVIGKIGLTSDKFHGSWGRVVWNNCCEDIHEIIDEIIENIENEYKEVEQLIKDARRISNLVIDENNEHDEDLCCEYRCLSLILEGELTRINARKDELIGLRGD